MRMTKPKSERERALEAEVVRLSAEVTRLEHEKEAADKQISYMYSLLCNTLSRQEHLVVEVAKAVENTRQTEEDMDKIERMIHDLEQVVSKIMVSMAKARSIKSDGV